LRTAGAIWSFYCYKFYERLKGTKCLLRINPPLGRDPRAEREAVESRLRIELDKAAAMYDTAKQNYQAALKLHDELGLGHADGAHAVRSALQQETAARSHYMERLSAFSDFLLHGKI